MGNRYLTKSRFKLARECPTKLYYAGKSEYTDKKMADSFLQALADGGFQVGELAKYYHPNGHDIDMLSYDEALATTNQLLTQDNVTIYEAAIAFENLFIRVDILVKTGNKIKLIEVKAKSAKEFYDKDKTIKPSWRPYFEDIAFQKYVTSNCFPDYEVSGYLMLVDKTSKCPTDGLNQKFKMKKDNNGRKKVILTHPLTKEDVAQKILCEINVEHDCEQIYSEEYEVDGNIYSFSDLISKYAESYDMDSKIKPKISKTCKECEYIADEQEIKSGNKSGFHECWKETLRWTDEDFKSGTVLDIWDFRTADELIDEGKIKLKDITEDYIGNANDGKAGLSRTQRQWLQIEKSNNNDNTYWIDKENLSAEMNKWRYPLHFIDFETSMVAIPFNKGRHPYEGIAFQYSHHIIYDNGKIEHKSQYLNTKTGEFPNYNFLRNLKLDLETDQGTIFRYAAHENTFLNMIYKQLMDDQEIITDKEDLCEFVKSITQSSKENWKGERNMVDMLELVKRYYYDPQMKRSNSIKVVLPAILNSSKYLQEKYSKPIYGIDNEIVSLNFKDWTWIQYQDNKVVDPYKLLPKMFDDVTDEDFILLNNEVLKDGGAAMTAYALMQFKEMTDYERSEIEKALLKYCELDTLAMVMIYEGWKNMIS